MTCGANHGLCSAGIRDLLWISGLRIFTKMKTVESRVVKDRIHLYFQRKKVSNPATGRKKEYQSRVSPMVRKGGLSRKCQRPTIKRRKISSPVTVSNAGVALRLLLSSCCPSSPKRIESMAKYINESSSYVAFALCVAFRFNLTGYKGTLPLPTA